MSLRRLAALIGFCFMLMAVTVLTHVFFVAWLYGADQISIYIDKLDERSLELWVIFLGFCLVPITIYEIDHLLREAGEP